MAAAIATVAVVLLLAAGGVFWAKKRATKRLLGHILAGSYELGYDDDEKLALVEMSKYDVLGTCCFGATRCVRTPPHTHVHLVLDGLPTRSPLSRTRRACVCRGTASTPSQDAPFTGLEIDAPACH